LPRDEGRRATEAFLATHGEDLGRRSSFDLDALLDTRVTPLTFALSSPPGVPSIIAEAVQSRPKGAGWQGPRGVGPFVASCIAVIRKRCRPRFRDGRAVARIASSSKTLWTESFAISVSPEVRYCVGTGTACWYGADNERLDQGEPERIVVLDRSYLETTRRPSGIA